jgi:tetratricopeptide (TPR) repeat protein
VIGKSNILLGLSSLMVGSIVGMSIANSLNYSGGALRSSATPPPPPQSVNLSPAPAKAVAGQQIMEEAGITIRQAKNEPENFDAQLQAAEIYYQVGGYEQAIGFLQRANQLRPGSDEVMVALGNIDFVSGRYEEAEQWFTAVLDKHPNDINIRTNLGMTFLFREQPDLERALIEFRRSLKINPRHEPTLQNMALALARKGDRAQAQLMLARLERVNPQNAALVDTPLPKGSGFLYFDFNDASLAS